jgi:hypothetical protein
MCGVVDEGHRYFSGGWFDDDDYCEASSRKQRALWSVLIDVTSSTSACTHHGPDLASAVLQPTATKKAQIRRRSGDGFAATRAFAIVFHIAPWARLRSRRVCELAGCAQRRGNWSPSHYAASVHHGLYGRLLQPLHNVIA